MAKFVFVSNHTVDSTFSSGNFCRFAVEVEGTRLDMQPIAGRAPTLEEFCSAVLETVFDKTETIPYADRINPYRTVVRTGYSGAQDYVLEEARNGNVVRHHVLHVSMHGKVNDPVQRVYLDDMLILLTRLGWVQPAWDMEGKKEHRPSAFLKDKFVLMEKRTPRDITQEDGWCYPCGDFIDCGDGFPVLPDISNVSGGYRVDSIISRLEKEWEEVEADLDGTSNG